MMKRHIAVGAGLIGIALVMPPAHVRSWLQLNVQPIVQPLCVLIARPTNSFTRVPEPPEAHNPNRSEAQNATITVTYGSGFAAFPAAQAAFQYAVDIWKTQVTSPVPITIQADFSSNLGSGVLGSAGYTSSWRNFTNAPVTGTWFPVPIVNMFTGSAINGSTADISANFSSTF